MVSGHKFNGYFRMVKVCRGRAIREVRNALPCSAGRGTRAWYNASVPCRFEKGSKNRSPQWSIYFANRRENEPDNKPIFLRRFSC
jgi:hypothetical protein